jgi:hypothetical protein
MIVVGDMKPTITTAVEEVQITNTLSLYPAYTTGDVIISRTFAKDKDAAITITDAMGREMASFTLSHQILIREKSILNIMCSWCSSLEATRGRDFRTVSGAVVEHDRNEGWAGQYRLGHFVCYSLLVGQIYDKTKGKLAEKGGPRPSMAHP